VTFYALDLAEAELRPTTGPKRSFNLFCLFLFFWQKPTTQNIKNPQNENYSGNEICC